MQDQADRRHADEHDTKNSETRPQRGGEGGTTRFGMEDGDNTDVPATGLDPDMQGGGR